MTGPGLDGPAVTVQRAAELLNCRRSRVFDLLAKGQLERAPRFGRKATVTTASVLALLEGRSTTRPKRRRSRAVHLAEEMRLARAAFGSPV